ncbi:hypothetical protein DL93DRAFT_2226542 [Clavulina sp. PMI_390]|nr:hypothetical protein DL93DRAFT_2226542 [Clavulina sp. PMI_390]
MGNHPSSAAEAPALNPYANPDPKPQLLGDGTEEDAHEGWKKRLTKRMNRLSRDSSEQKGRPLSNTPPLPPPPTLIYTPPTPERSNTEGAEESLTTPGKSSEETPVLQTQKADPQVWRIRFQITDLTGSALPPSPSPIPCLLELDGTSQVFRADLAQWHQPVWETELAFWDEGNVEYYQNLILKCTVTVRIDTDFKGVLQIPWSGIASGGWFGAVLSVRPTFYGPPTDSRTLQARLFVDLARAQARPLFPQPTNPWMPLANALPSVTPPEFVPPLQQSHLPPTISPSPLAPLPTLPSPPSTPSPSSPPPPPTLPILLPEPVPRRRLRPVSIWSPHTYSAPHWGPRSSIWAH